LYLSFIRFLAPLVVATVVLELGGQFLNGGMARVPQATETLAAFGLAYGLSTILSGPLYQTRQLGLAVIDNLSQLATGTRFVVVAGTILSLATVIVSLPGPGRWLIQDLHAISPNLADQTQLALLWMAPLTLVNGLARYYSGLLVRFRRTEIISLSSIGGIVVKIGAVFVLLGEPIVQNRPMFLPIGVTVIGSMAEFLILLWGHVKYTRPALSTEGPAISHRDIFKFLWPLALIMTFQGVSRPLINLVVSRGADATEALAALTVVYALGHIHYGWLNELRSLASAFRDEKDNLKHIARFSVGCTVVSFSLALILFWTPIRLYLLIDLIGIDRELADLCTVPLMIFSFFPFAVTLRGYYHGVGIVKRMTSAMAVSAPSRVGAITLALVLFSFLGVPGATMGIGALFCGFASESLAVTWGVRRRIRTNLTDGETDG
jgi:uncharacterized protein (DUF697 family)